MITVFGVDGDGNDDDERGVNHYNKFRTLQKIPPKNPKNLEKSMKSQMIPKIQKNSQKFLKVSMNLRKSQKYPKISKTQEDQRSPKYQK